jgi:hypothetical protein
MAFQVTVMLIRDHLHESDDMWEPKRAIWDRVPCGKGRLAYDGLGCTSRYALVYLWGRDWPQQHTPIYCDRLDQHNIDKVLEKVCEYDRTEFLFLWVYAGSMSYDMRSFTIREKGIAQRWLPSSPSFCFSS